MLGEYAREHVLLCLVPAFFIAGAIMVFLRRDAVLRYLGPDAPAPVAYGVASVSGAILAVCSCTVLPVFKGIYRKGAGLGPAVAFLYSGPAINILAIILTAKVLGIRLGIARAVGAIVFAVIAGLVMHLVFERGSGERDTNAAMFSSDGRSRDAWKHPLIVGALIAFLVVVNWAPSGGSVEWWDAVYRVRYVAGAAILVALLVAIARSYSRGEIGEWMRSTRDFAIQIVPLLFAGVLVAGFLLGRPGQEAMIPERWIAELVGGNSVRANLVAAVAGALMYFATLTEIPIMQGLLGAGMGSGPALALLLAGPSLSLPSLLVIWGELGWRKTAVYVTTIVVLSTAAGVAFGTMS
jgi:hypothetical protein